MGNKVMPMTIERFEEFVDMTMNKIKTYPYPFIMDHKKFIKKFSKTLRDNIEENYSYKTSKESDK